MTWLNLNTTDVSKHINWHVDAALIMARNSEPKRDYLGASIIGYDCERRIQLMYMGESEQFTGQKLRIFQRGHVMETMAIEFLTDAGFTIDCEGERGQHGFVDGHFSGHVDGVFVESSVWMVKCPCIWEHKGLGGKGWKSVEKSGVKDAYPHYYAQIQVYQAEMGLTNPALFTATNADTMEMYHELVEHNPEFAKMQIAKAHRIIKETKERKQSPKAYDAPGMECKMCGFNKRCWA